MAYDVDPQLLHQAADYVARYRSEVPRHRVVADDFELSSARFDLPLPDQSLPAERVIAELIAAAEPGLTASTGPRYFGFVVGGSLPVTVAADFLATGWDQNAYNGILSPAALAAEKAAGSWIKELLQLPGTASVGFVTGAQAANTVGLTAGRHHVLTQAGWDVERRGLFGAPALRVLAGEERHATIDRSLRLLGLGSDILEEVEAEAKGSISIEDLESKLEQGDGAPTIVCLQAGNVNTGACDNFRASIELAHQAGAWVHIDGAFGLWAAAGPTTRHVVDGLELADSWACDAHKWLNVPYDSAFAIVSRPDVHVAAMSYSAPYLVGSGQLAQPGSGADAGLGDLTPESSRRARGFTVWAALRHLGRAGVADIVERCCAHARRFAEGFRAAGYHVANEVVLNQVLVSFGSDEVTDQVIAATQADGTCWMGGTTWRGHRYMRVSVSNYSTTTNDVDRSLAAIISIANRK